MQYIYCLPTKLHLNGAQVMNLTLCLLEKDDRLLNKHPNFEISRTRKVGSFRSYSHRSELVVLMLCMG